MTPMLALWGLISIGAVVFVYRWQQGQRHRQIDRLRASRDRITAQIKSLYGGGTRCPNCFRWPWDCANDRTPQWRSDSQPAEMHCRECGHTSYWIDGPGIMLSVKPPTAPIDIG